MRDGALGAQEALEAAWYADAETRFAPLPGGVKSPAHPWRTGEARTYTTSGGSPITDGRRSGVVAPRTM